MATGMASSAASYASKIRRVWRGTMRIPSLRGPFTCRRWKATLRLPVTGSRHTTSPEAMYGGSSLPATCTGRRVTSTWSPFHTTSFTGPEATSSVGTRRRERSAAVGTSPWRVVPKARAACRRLAGAWPRARHPGYPVRFSNKSAFSRDWYRRAPISVRGSTGLRTRTSSPASSNWPIHVRMSAGMVPSCSEASGGSTRRPPTGTAPVPAARGWRRPRAGNGPSTRRDGWRRSPLGS